MMGFFFCEGGGIISHIVANRNISKESALSSSWSECFCSVNCTLLTNRSNASTSQINGCIIGCGEMSVGACSCSTSFGFRAQIWFLCRTVNSHSFNMLHCGWDVVD